MNRSQKYVFIKSQNGLGDRIMTLASALYYAGKTDRKVIVDWSDDMYSDGEANAFEELFRVKLPDLFASKEEVLSRPYTVAPDIWKNRADHHHWALLDEVLGGHWNKEDAMSQQQIDMNQDYDEDIVIIWSADQLFWDQPKPVVGLGSDLEARNGLACQLLLDAVEPTPSIQQAVKEFREAHTGKRWIGLHVRAADEGHTRHVPLEYYVALTAAYLKRYPDAVVFVATDNIDALGQLKAVFPEVTSYPKWYPPRGEAMHFGNDRPAPLERAREALIDILLLADCDVILRPCFSNFSIVSHFLQNTKVGAFSLSLPGRGAAKRWPISVLKSLKMKWQLKNKLARAIDR